MVWRVILWLRSVLSRLKSTWTIWETLYSGLQTLFYFWRVAHSSWCSLQVFHQFTSKFTWRCHRSRFLTKAMPIFHLVLFQLAVKTDQYLPIATIYSKQSRLLKFHKLHIEFILSISDWPGVNWQKTRFYSVFVFIVFGLQFCNTLHIKYQFWVTEPSHLQEVLS